MAAKTKRKSITHEERRERRRKMAEAVKGGASRETVSRRYRVSMYTVDQACREFKVPVDAAPTPSKPTTLEVIAGLLRGESPTALAAQHDVSRQWIHQIRDKARDAGIFEAAKPAVARVIVSVTGGVVGAVRASSKDVSIDVLDHDDLGAMEAGGKAGQREELEAARALFQEYESLPSQVY